MKDDAMDEPIRKKTMPAWRPPAGATRVLEHGIKEELPTDGSDTSQAAPDTSQSAQQSPGAAVAGSGSAANAPTDLDLRPPPAPPLAAAAPAPTHSTIQPRQEPRDPNAPLGPGDIIGGRYVIKQLAGQGGFAAVYRAADAEIPNHEVAVKLLNAPAKGPEAQAAALRELTLIASVSHPSVVQFKDYGWHEGRLFFAMPWYRGHTLGEVVPLDRASARRVFERSAYGLSAMHDAGICHYDIKPDNIFLAEIAGFEAGFPVLLDLGIAAKRGETPKALTPEYASPETALAIMNNGQTPVGTAADVYSLALSLRNVLEPETAPTFGESLPALLHQRATEPVPPPTKKDLQYLRPQFLRWLSIEPTDRPSAAEFALELAALTAPEERRADRQRLLRRIAPFVALAAIVVTVLSLQLTKKTNELVQQKQAEAQDDIETNARFEQMKEQNKNQLDAKLQLAQQFQMQRDQFKQQRDTTQTELSSVTADRNHARTDLRTRTKERDDARTQLDAQTAAVAQARAELAQRNQDLDARTRDLAQARNDLNQRNSDLARRTQDLTQAQADVARLTRDAAAQAQRLDGAQRDLQDAKAALDKRTDERDKARKDFDKRSDQLDDMKRERDTLKKQLDKSEKELDKANKALVKTKKRDVVAK